MRNNQKEGKTVLGGKKTKSKKTNNKAKQEIEHCPEAILKHSKESI